ncbi:MAG: DUF4976 domain-containing protein, partial [Bacteroidetes bacterium]|nr:DUF4976 domain-containing protein [Bacteroidota bacterium]
RLPGEAEAGSSSDALVQNLDFAETFLDLAGASIPTEMQGMSLLGPMNEATQTGDGIPKDWRTSIYYHYYEYPGAHAVKRHYGVRSEQYKLIHFYHDIDEWELYDLEKDPKEMMNVIDDPDYAKVLIEMQEELKKLQEEYGDSEEGARELIPNK